LRIQELERNRHRAVCRQSAHQLAFPCVDAQGKGNHFFVGVHNGATAIAIALIQTKTQTKSNEQTQTTTLTLEPCSLKKKKKKKKKKKSKVKFCLFLSRCTRNNTITHHIHARTHTHPTSHITQTHTPPPSLSVSAILALITTSVLLSSVHWSACAAQAGATCPLQAREPARSPVPFATCAEFSRRACCSFGETETVRLASQLSSKKKKSFFFFFSVFFFFFVIDEKLFFSPL
jgi:hypothetical protein